MQQHDDPRADWHDHRCPAVQIRSKSFLYMGANLHIDRAVQKHRFQREPRSAEFRLRSCASLHFLWNLIGIEASEFIVNSA